MSLKEDFRVGAGVISDRMRDLTGKRGAWSEDLEAALEGVGFSAEQVAAIEAAATPTCLQDLGDGSGGKVVTSLGHKLTHAFRDPVMNSAMIMNMCAGGYFGQTPSEALVMMVQARGALADIVHNYPLLLRDEMPGEVRRILGVYEQEILPAMNDLIERLAKESGDNPAAIPPSEDWQHLHRLDPAPFL